MKKIPKNSAASILARLKNVSKERGLDHTQTLTQYAIERLLYRLSLSQYRDRFVLKGAMLFVLKDYYDLFHLISHYEFDGQRVYEAIEGTFSRRGTSLDNTLPAGLAEEFLSDTTKQTQWKAFLRKSKLSDASPDLEVVVAALVRFLKPLLAACVKDAPLEMRWGAGKWSKTI